VIVEVDRSSPVPVYRQICDQVTTMAGRGVLPGGERLPAVRRLAAELGLSNGTLARAYRELEKAGVVETRGRHGTFVTPGRLVPDGPGRLRDRARAFAVEVQQLGADHGEALGAVRDALDRLDRLDRLPPPPPATGPSPP
jgi:DNA-binding transcriptional regulator YhcF (GntR family)